MKKMKKKSIWKAGSAALAGILTVAMLAGIFSNDKVALAAEKISDLDTTMKYTESLGDNASTEYSGRVWSDKTVYSDGSATFEVYGGKTYTIKVDPEKFPETDDPNDFLVAFSTLATSEAIQGETTAPIDVVFVIDISGSMSNGDSDMDDGQSRIYNTVEALNTSIDTVLSMNEHTRVGVAVFSTNSEMLLPLDHYTKQNGNNWFTVSRETGYDDTGWFSEPTTITVRAVDSKGNSVEKERDVTGGTNIQMGLYEGLKILASEKVTTANIDGTSVKRVPSLILLSDGAPTYSSTSKEWYSPSNNSNHGNGSTAYYGNGMKAMMTGAYMKASVDRNYGVAGTPSKTSIYTIGMGLQGLDEGNEKDLASITLNPAENWSKNNTMANSIRRAWSSYSGGGSPSIQINGGNSNYSLGHPEKNDVTSISDYVDAYYSADDANSVTNVFETIVANISLATPQVPTEMTTDDPLTDGYITYVDPIGKYMTVKDVKSILYAGGNYTVKTKKTEGNKTTYVFTEEVHSVVYGNQSLANIIIEVTGVGTDNEVMTIMVPASVIPLRVNTVALNKDDSVKSHTNNGAYPMRVLYTVGLQPELVTDDGIIDTEKLSADYIKANSNNDGTINFYSNLYTGTKVVNGKKAGDAYVKFDPAPTNKFYYMQKPVSLYEDI